MAEFPIRTRHKVMIIAEVGTNHNGDLDTALRYIDVAAACGADVVKFQSHVTEELVGPENPNFERLKAVEIPYDWYPKLIQRCKDNGVYFLSTATSFKTIGWLEEFGVEMYKVASGNITHRPIIDKLIEINKPVILSLGVIALEEIYELAAYFDSRGFDKYALLHCVAKYPTPAADLKLKNISVLRDTLECPIGFSDHSWGSHMAPVAVALGATIIEKHISLDKQGRGMDHEVAILPDEFAEMCKAIREAESALYADFTVDRELLYTLRRSLHFRHDLPEGAVITMDDLKITRPENGLAPKELSKVLGKRLSRNVAANDPVLNDLLNE